MSVFQGESRFFQITKVIWRFLISAVNVNVCFIFNYDVFIKTLIN